MPSTTWIAGNGNFFTAGNWDNGVPVAGDDGTIEGTTAAALTITYDGTDTLNTLTLAYLTLAMTGGTLTITSADGSPSFDQDLVGLDASFTQSAGLIDFQNSRLNGSVTTPFSGVFTQTGGTIETDAGILSLTGGGSFAGTLSGAGTVMLGGGMTYTLKAGIDLLDGNLVVTDAGTVLALDTHAIQKNFFLGAGTTLSVGNHDLNIGGTSVLGGLVTGSNRVLVAGHLQDGGLSLGGGASILNAGIILQTGQNTLGNGTGVTAINTVAGAVYNIGFVATASGSSLFFGDGQGQFNNGGTFEVTGGGLIQIIDTVNVRFVNSYAGNNGTIDVGNNGLYFNIASDFAGTIKGGLGSIVQLGGGGQQTLEPGLVDGVPILEIRDSGTTLNVLGALSIGQTLNHHFYETLNQDAGTSILFGSNALTVAAGATFNTTGFVGGSGTITNAGTLEGTGSGTSQIDPQVSNTGTVIASAGTLAFANTVTNNASMTASGAELLFSGTLTETSGDHGKVSVSQGGIVSFAGSVNVGQTLDFADNTGFAIVTSQNLFQGTIAGFVLSDTIDVTGLAQPTTKGYIDNVLTLSNTLAQSVSLKFAGSYTLGDFSVSSDHHSGTYITYTPPADRPDAYAPSHAVG